MRKQTIIIALACMGWTVKAQDTLKTVRLDEVVITGTKSEIPVEKSGKTIFKITRKDIEASGSRTLADILNQVPGVQMDGNFGPLGTNIGYFIRGASSKRTLVLIDGVPFNDPSGIDQTYDFRLLDLDQVESIEILKGGLSTLYGTGAAAGVINITLKKASEEGLGGSVDVGIASFSTLSSNLNLSGKSNQLSYFFNGGYKTSDGFSSAKDTNGNNNFDDDGFDGFNVLGKLTYDFSDQFSLGLTASLDDFETEYDQGAFTDGDNTSEYQQIRIGLSPRLKWQSGDVRGEIFYSKLDRLFDSPDFFDPNARFIDEYDAYSTQADIIMDQHLTDNVKLIGGLNYQNFSYSQPNLEEQSFNMIDPYVTFIYDQSAVNVQVGGRLNSHSEYGNNVVWNVNPSYRIETGELNIKIFSSYSTSFITPSLFQLFGPFGGNADLQPEESRSTEGGLSLSKKNRQIEAVYFHRIDENLIIYNSSFEYENAKETIETDGLDFSGKVKATDQIDISANYTFIRRLDESKLYRIPSHKYGASMNFRPISGLILTVKYLHTGGRTQQYYDDTTFSVEETELEAYDLVDLAASFRFQSFTVSGGINNVLGEEYQAIYGFTTVGRNFSAQIKYSF